MDQLKNEVQEIKKNTVEHTGEHSFYRIETREQQVYFQATIDCARAVESCYKKKDVHN